jgi:iron complex outermembrane receptor protein
MRTRTTGGWFKLSPLAAAFLSLPAAAQDAGQPAESRAVSPVVVTATRLEQPSFDLPVAIDSVGREQIQETGRPQVNISEQLNKVPGAFVSNREAYAQEQQITIRGFGSRSTFGTRGVKLLADGIPAVTPDGQGSPGLFDLQSAERIEVLRGPFSALYGNHSGGVVQVFTEDGPERPTVTVEGLGGSWGTWKGGLKFGGGGDSGVNYIGSLSRYYSDGYREHSEAQKDQFNGKIRTLLPGGGTLTFVANYLDQPENQDPLGLTAQQVRDNPRQAGTDAVRFDTRRSLDNKQAGLVYEQPVNDANTVRAMVYLGERNNDGYLAIAPGTQNNVKQSGGVSVLSRNFGGAGLRWTHRNELFGGPLTLQAGGDYDRSTEDRKGYLNFLGSAGAPAALGVKGALKRDEDNTVDSWGTYLQAEWAATQKLSLSAGVRYTEVSFDSQDNFICTNTVNTTGTPLGTCSGSTNAVTSNRTTWNPDDSGSKSYSAITPVAGVLYKLTPALNVYANAGRSFETPTFIELAYQSDPNASGLNFALKPAKSDHYEVGAKVYLTPQTRMDVALFLIDTRDEIVVETNVNGRQSYKNAGDTQRQGVEVSLSSAFGHGFTGFVAATWLNAEFKDSFRSCSAPPCGAGGNQTVNAGNKIPGVPDYQLYGELAWRHAASGFNTGVEVRTQGKVYVNDVNSEAADAFTVVALRAGLEQRLAKWRFSEFVRVDNVFNVDYVGAVGVNDANGRYYFPAPTATLSVGGTVAYSF